jgi:hypothetical protein
MQNLVSFSHTLCWTYLCSIFFYLFIITCITKRYIKRNSIKNLYIKVLKSITFHLNPVSNAIIHMITVTDYGRPVWSTHLCVRWILSLVPSSLVGRLLGIVLPIVQRSQLIIECSQKNHVLSLIALYLSTVVVDILTNLIWVKIIEPDYFYFC